MQNNGGPSRVRDSWEPGRASTSTGVVFSAVLDHLNGEATRRCMQELAQEIDAHCRRLAGLAGLAGMAVPVAGAGAVSGAAGAGGADRKRSVGWDWSPPLLWLLALALGWLAGHHVRHCCATACGEGAVAAVQQGAGPTASTAMDMCLAPMGGSAQGPVCLWRRRGCIPASAPARPRPGASRPQGARGQGSKAQGGAPRPAVPPVPASPVPAPAAPGRGAGPAPAAPRPVAALPRAQKAPEPAARPVPVRPAPRPRPRPRPPLIYCDPATID